MVEQNIGIIMLGSPQQMHRLCTAHIALHTWANSCDGPPWSSQLNPARLCLSLSPPLLFSALSFSSLVAGLPFSNSATFCWKDVLYEYRALPTLEAKKSWTPVILVKPTSRAICKFMARLMRPNTAIRQRKYWVIDPPPPPLPLLPLCLRSTGMMNAYILKMK